MPRYIFISSLTDEGRKTIKKNPERIQAVNTEIEKMGVKIIDQYAVLGLYDFITVVEAADNESIGKVSMELSARGTVQIITLAAIPVDEFIESLKK